MRPRTRDIERQAGGVLGFLAGRVRLNGVDPQSPTLAAKINEPVRFGGDAMARHHGAPQPGAPVVQRD